MRPKGGHQRTCNRDVLLLNWTYNNVHHNGMRGGALFNYRHIYLKLRDIFLSALSAAVICDLFTLIVIFFRLNAVKNLKSTITKTFSGKQIIFLCSCGGGSLPVL